MYFFLFPVHFSDLLQQKYFMFQILLVSDWITAFFLQFYTFYLMFLLLFQLCVTLDDVVKSRNDKAVHDKESDVQDMLNIFGQHLRKLPVDCFFEVQCQMLTVIGTFRKAYMNNMPPPAAPPAPPAPQPQPAMQSSRQLTPVNYQQALRYGGSSMNVSSTGRTPPSIDLFSEQSNQYTAEQYSPETFLTGFPRASATVTSLSNTSQMLSSANALLQNTNNM